MASVLRQIELIPDLEKVVSDVMSQTDAGRAHQPNTGAAFGAAACFVTLQRNA